MMSQLEFNVKAKFVYTKLLPLLQEASRDNVESVSYEGREDEETVVINFENGAHISVDVTADSLLSLAKDVLEAVS